MCFSVIPTSHLVSRLISVSQICTCQPVTAAHHMHSRHFNIPLMSYWEKMVSCGMYIINIMPSVSKVCLTGKPFFFCWLLWQLPHILSLGNWNCLWNKYSSLITIWATSRQNQQNGTCAQRRLRSAWASAQSDQSCCPHEESLGP